MQADLFFYIFCFCVDFHPPSDGKKKMFIVVGAVALALFLILGILWWKFCFGGRISREQGGVKLLHKPKYFLLSMLATI